MVREFAAFACFSAISLIKEWEWRLDVECRREEASLEERFRGLNFVHAQVMSVTGEPTSLLHKD